MPAIINCDVLVIGGGAAGIAAAIAAGRAGAQVILLERYGFLGGLATTAQVGTICGLYLRDSTSTAPTPVSTGFPAEFASRLQQWSNTKPLSIDPGLWVLPYTPPDFAQVADAFIRETKRITLILHATLSQVRADNSRIREVQALAWNESIRIHPSMVVDSTGEATAATLGGATSRNGIKDQAPALVFTLENVDPGLATRGLLEVRRELRFAVENNLLPTACERISLIPGSGINGSFAFKLSLLPALGTQPLWQQVTEWERDARSQVNLLVRFLIAKVAAFQQARLHSIAPQLGVRSGRRIIGRLQLTDEDVLLGRKSPLSVAQGCWPMERWGDRPKPELTYFAERDFYDIPLDCLRPVELDNTFVAGRCLSADSGAMTSARVIGTALATGWAAGTAAFQTSSAGRR